MSFNTLQGGRSFPIDHAGGGGGGVDIDSIKYTFGGVIVIATATSFLAVGGPQSNSVATERSDTIAFDGTLQFAFAVHNSPAGVVALVYTVFLATVATGLTVPLSSGTAQGSNLITTVAATRGQRIGVQVTNPALANQTVNVCFSVLLTR